MTWEENDVVLALVRPLVVIMFEIIVERALERRFAEADEAVEAFFLDRANEPLGKGVEVWAAAGNRSGSMPAD